VLLPLVSLSQSDDVERQVFFRTGIDLTRFVLPYTNDYAPNGIELSFDTEIKYNFFPTVEIGYTKIDDDTDLHKYESSGSYIKVGLNYNILKYKQRLDRNIFFVGARYSYSNFYNRADEINIENQWGVFKDSFDYNNLSAHWLEGVIGIRSEIFKNFYMGYTIRIKTMLYHSDFENFTPYWIPGYNQATKSIAVGMSYSIFYAIPIKKVTLDFNSNN
jgi:hypothetical protein